MSGVWTTGRCEEESAGAVEVVNFSFFFFLFFFLFFWERDLWDWGWGMMTFRFFMREGGREGLVGAFFGEGEKELWIYTPLSDFVFLFFSWFGSVLMRVDG